MIRHPGIDPIAISLGPIKVHWYGLMYLFGFWTAWWLALRRGRMPHARFAPDQVSDLLFYGVVGVILGGRIGYTLFYNLHGFLQDPAEIFRIWEGGMSFHGGLLGVISAMALFARSRRMPFLYVADFVAVVVPAGLFFGRIGNFINQELWGAPTDLPWAMVFPHDPSQLPRHPSMLYEAILEGPVMLATLWWFGLRRHGLGAIAGLFLLLYGSFRWLVEFVRLPDEQIGYLAFGWLTMGQILSLPMLLLGAWLLFGARRRPAWAPEPPTSEIKST